MQRLKDVYYTDQILDGNIPIDGIKQPAPQFYQGEDITLYFVLCLEDKPVTPETHNVEIIVKKSPVACHILWKGVFGNGVYKAPNKADGTYYLLLPAEISSLLLPGTYYIDAKIGEKIGSGQLAKDVFRIQPVGSINIDISSASPNPRLRNTRTEETAYDAKTGVTTVTIKLIESTLPLPIAVI